MPFFEVRPVPGVRPSKQRGLAFLISDQDADWDAGSVFDRLSTIPRRRLLDRMDFWVEGGRNDNYFHGWPNDPDHKECFCFKWNDKKSLHRLYGYLCHLKNDGRFQLCVLVSHAVKTTWETDVTHLHRAQELRVDPRAIAAISMAFTNESHPCLN